MNNIFYVRTILSIQFRYELSHTTVSPILTPRCKGPVHVHYDARTPRCVLGTENVLIKGYEKTNHPRRKPTDLNLDDWFCYLEFPTMRKPLLYLCLANVIYNPLAYLVGTILSTAFHLNFGCAHAFVQRSVNSLANQSTLFLKPEVFKQHGY